MNKHQVKETLRRIDSKEGTKHLARYDSMSSSQKGYFSSLYDQEFGGARIDANGAILLSEQIEYMFTESYKEEFEELQGVNGQILSIDTSVPENAKQYSYKYYRGTAIAQFISELDNGLDLPDSSLEAEEVIGRTHWIATRHGYTMQELVAASAGDINIDTEKASNSRRAQEELWEKTWMLGDEKRGLLGFLTHPNITVSEVSTNSSSQQYFRNKTTRQVAADIASLINRIKNDTNDRHMATHVGLSSDAYDFIKQTPWSEDNTAGNTTTILQWLESVHPEITFVTIRSLAASKSDGNFEDDAMIAWKQFPGNQSSFVLTRDFDVGEMQRNGLRMDWWATSRIGGCKIVYPLTVHLAIGTGRT